MKIITSLMDVPQDFGPSVVALGNFDGVHLGHRELFRKLHAWSLQINCPSVICTFEPHPLKLLAPEKAPYLLNTRTEKHRLIAASHINYLVEIPFSYDFAKMPPEQFANEILLDLFKAKALVVGYDYAFGRDRMGNATFLTAFGKKNGLIVDVLQPVGVDGKPFSSTQIRDLIQQGEVSEVVELLGRHYTFEGCVVSGFQRGRQMGFPTANLETDKELLPAPGVYAVKIRFEEQEYNGVVNIGHRPTFANGNLSIEVHILDFSEDLYGKKLRVYFVERLRDEQKFADPAALSNAIASDVLRARQILETCQIVQYREYLSLK